MTPDEQAKLVAEIQNNVRLLDEALTTTRKLWMSAAGEAITFKAERDQAKQADGTATIEKEHP